MLPLAIALCLYQPVQPPVGLFVCKGPRPTATEEVDYPFVDGWLIRPGWQDVEPKDGVFDWSYVDSEIALAKKLHKKITLSVLGGPQTPAWVYTDGAKSFSYDMPVVPRGKAKLPLLWDATYQAKWSELIAALGKRYGAEPTVVLIHMTGATGNGLEMLLPFSPSDRDAWKEAGYTNDNAIKGWKGIVDAFAKAFPSKPLDVDVHPVLDSDEVAASVAAYASEKLGKRFGIFGGWLSGKNSTQDSHHAGMHALAEKYGPKGFSAWQMIASATQRPSAFGDGTLKSAFEQGRKWNARYFEVWDVDVRNEKLQPLLREVEEKLLRG